MAELQKASSLDTERLGVSESGQLANQLAMGYFRGVDSGAEEITASSEPVSLDPELQRRIRIEPDLASNHLLMGATYLLVHHFESTERTADGEFASNRIIRHCTTCLPAITATGGSKKPALRSFVRARGSFLLASYRA